MSRTSRRQRRRIQATEGQAQDITLESLLEASRSVGAIPGTTNNYQTYEAQTTEGYRKYNGKATWGSPQYRAIVDIRTSFIAGEGLNISAENDRTGKWIDEFIAGNELFSSRFFDLVLGTEITGKSLVALRPRRGDMPKAIRIPWTPASQWSVKLADAWDPESIVGVTIKRGNTEEPLPLGRFVFMRLGGDDHTVNATTTRCGIVLNEFENYDRALKDLRLNNHVFARITPDLEVENERQAQDAINALAGGRWKIGKMRIGVGKFNYKAPPMGAADNLKAEMSTTLKTISAITGVPVHWAGWADLLSNRATADNLAETISNATARERTIIAAGIKDLLIQAQELYINTGGTMISTVDRDISVSIPIVDRSKMLDLVRALSVAFNDEVISRADYQGSLPGIDPRQTEKQIAAERKAAPVVIPSQLPPPDGGEGDDNGES